MNIPNQLTMSRVVMAAVLIALLQMSFPYAKTLALLVFVVAGITDYLDGYLARNVYGETAFGRLMDPLTDKIIVCAAFVCFVGVQVPGHGSLVPAWIVVIIISREFLVTGLRLLAVGRDKVISAGKFGKHKTVWQIIAINVLLLGLAIRYDYFSGAPREFLKDYDFAFGYIAQGVSMAVGLITVASGGLYFFEHRKLLSQHQI